MGSVTVNVADVGDLVVALQAKTNVGGRALSVNGTAVNELVNYSTGVWLGGWLFPDTTGALTVSSTGGGGAQTLTLQAAVYTGVSTVSPIGATAVSSGLSSASSGALGSSAGDLVVTWARFGAGATYTSGNFTTGAGIVKVDITGGVQGMQCWGETSGATTVDPHWNHVNSTTWMAFALTLNAAAAAANRGHNAWVFA